MDLPWLCPQCVGSCRLFCPPWRTPLRSRAWGDNAGEGNRGCDCLLQHGVHPGNQAVCARPGSARSAHSLSSGPGVECWEPLQHASESARLHQPLSPERPPRRLPLGLPAARVQNPGVPRVVQLRLPSMLTSRGDLVSPTMPAPWLRWIILLWKI